MKIKLFFLPFVIIFFSINAAYADWSKHDALLISTKGRAWHKLYINNDGNNNGKFEILNDNFKVYSKDIDFAHFYRKSGWGIKDQFNVSFVRDDTSAICTITITQSSGNIWGRKTYGACHFTGEEPLEDSSKNHLHIPGEVMKLQLTLE